MAAVRLTLLSAVQLRTWCLFCNQVAETWNRPVGCQRIDRKYGVKTDFIARGGDRVGIYYLETGASMRPSKVIYDRAHSAIAEADAADFDFDAIMEGADWFHWSGITPAISDKAAELTRLLARLPNVTAYGVGRPQFP